MIRLPNSSTRFVAIAALSLALAGCSDNVSDQTTSDQGASAEGQSTSAGKTYLGAKAWPKIVSPVPKDPAVEQKIVDILAQMSLEEKVGQIMQTEIQFTTPQDIKDYHLGSVLNGGGSFPNKNKQAKPDEWLAMADSFYDASMDTSDGKIAIPIIWGSDAVHGHSNVIGATIFPHNIGLGAMRNPDLVRRIGWATAREMRVTGIDWTFAPTLAVVQDDRWGRTYESYSENPEVVNSYADQMVYGIQGEPTSAEFLDENHAVSTAKHYVGDGGTTNGDDQGNAEISEAELRDIHAAGYFSALEAGVQTVMASFSSWNGDKMHGHKYLMTDVLRDQMGFDGFIVGDWNGHGQLPSCDNLSCSTTINAGLDMFMASVDNWKELYNNTLAQVQSGEIPMTRLDDAVSRILRVKIRAGLFDKGRPSTRGIAGAGDIIGSDEHRAIARQAVRESLVLIKNDGVLPLKPSQKILVAGDGADNIGKQSGGWTITWQGTDNLNSDFPNGTSILGGIEEAVAAGNGSVTYSLDGSYSDRPDVAVVVFGEEPYAEFQGDRDTLEFEPGDKKSLALLKKFQADNIPVVSVFLSGRPMWTNPEINASNAFVAAWLPGTEGAGVADVLVADASGNPRFDFKGSLSFSWPKTPVQGPLNPHHDGYDPLFAYGYGLSYAAPGDSFVALAEDVEGVVTGEAEEIFWYNGRALSPFGLYLGKDGNGGMVSGPRKNVENGAMTIETTDRAVQEDSRRVVWTDPAYDGYVWISGPETELTRFASEGVLTFWLKIDQLSNDLKVWVGEKHISLNKKLADNVGQGWQEVSVKMGCFAPESGDLKAISRPFALQTSGPAQIEFSAVKYLVRGESNISCD